MQIGLLGHAAQGGSHHTQWEEVAKYGSGGVHRTSEMRWTAATMRGKQMDTWNAMAQTKWTRERKYALGTICGAKVHGNLAVAEEDCPQGRLRDILFAAQKNMRYLTKRGPLTAIVDVESGEIEAIASLCITQSLGDLCEENDELRSALEKAQDRIAHLERRLAHSILKTPTKPYVASEDRLPFVSPESPFPTDLDSSAQGDDEE